MKRSQQEIDALKVKYPNFPAAYIPTHKKKSKNPTNELQNSIIQYVKDLGGYGMRINTQGTYSEAKGMYIHSGSTKGVADILIVYKGRLIACEVKRGSDKMRPDQIKFQKDVEAAGGKYIIVSSMDSFILQFTDLRHNL